MYVNAKAELVTLAPGLRPNGASRRWLGDKRCLIISKKKPQKVFALYVPPLMTAALYRTVPPNNPCMLCALNWEIANLISNYVNL